MVVWLLGRTRVVAAVAVTIVLVAGCSSSSPSTSTTSSSSAPPATSSASSATPSGSAASSTSSGPESAAAAQITAAWTEFFDGATPAARKAQLLENGQVFAPVIAGLAASPLAKSAKATVSEVQVTSPDKATVTYSVSIGGQPALTNQTGTAVLVDGQWKVGDASFCQLLSLQGAAPALCRTSSTAAS